MAGRRSGYLLTKNSNIGSSDIPEVLEYDGKKALTIYTTCASTDGNTSFEPVLINTTLTGAGQVGGRVRVHMDTNVALGGWSNALKASVTYGASGRTTGLGSAFCAETTLSAGTSSGTYCALEAELVLGDGALTGTATSFIYCNAMGAAASTFDTNGFLIEIGTGITPAAGKFVSANSQTIKCKVEANTRYMVLSTAEDSLTFSGGAVGFDITSTLPAGAASNANEINVTDNTTGSSGYARGLWINATVAGTKTSSGEHNSFSVDQHVTGDTPYLYGMTYYSYDTGNPTIGLASAFSVYQDDLGTALGAYCMFDLGVALSNAPADRYSYFRCRTHSTAIPTSIFRFEADCATNLFDTTAGTGVPDFITAETGATFAGDGIKIAVSHQGTTYYLRACTAFS